MLPPTCVGRCRRSISPTKAVVVLLPLEPVTPRTGAGQADRKRFISEVILARALRAMATNSERALSTAGLTTTMSASVKSAAWWPPR